jgi:hypothetical protein
MNEPWLVPRASGGRPVDNAVFSERVRMRNVKVRKETEL